MTQKYYSGLSFFLGFGVVITWNSSAHVVLVNTADPITPKMLNRPMSSFRPAELFGLILDDVSKKEESGGEPIKK